MKFNTLHQVLRRASSKLCFWKKSQPTPKLSESLTKLAEMGHTSPELYKATLLTLIRVKGLRGYRKQLFRKHWRETYRWQDTDYLEAAAELLESEDL